LCFSTDELTLFPTERLPLFSPVAFKWGYDNILQTIFEVNETVRKLGLDSQPFDEAKIESIDLTNELIVGYKRYLSNSELIVLGNFSQVEQKGSFKSLTNILQHSEILLGEFCLTNDDNILLHPWGYLVLLNMLRSC
ncbi:MAG: hypothetical protein ACK4SO_01455, partial [Candidatus Kapaibacteriota bacterium]